MRTKTLSNIYVLYRACRKFEGAMGLGQWLEAVQNPTRPHLLGSCCITNARPLPHNASVMMELVQISSPGGMALHQPLVTDRPPSYYWTYLDLVLFNTAKSFANLSWVDCFSIQRNVLKTLYNMTCLTFSMIDEVKSYGTLDQQLQNLP